MDVVIAASAEVDPSAAIGPGSRIWDLARVREGARIGGRCTVGRAADVVREIPDLALGAGSAPRRVGWVGRAGVPLVAGDRAGTWRCPTTGTLHAESDGVLREDAA